MRAQKGQTPKTNAVRALEQKGIPYGAFEYDPEIRSAIGVAKALGVSPSQVFKTLVMVRDGGGRPLLVMVPGDLEVHPKTLAAVLGSRSVRMAAKGDAERVTGLQTGGIGALALIGRPFDVYIDASALDREQVYVNGGRRGLNLLVNVRDLVEVTGARPVSVAGRVT
jgi:Cys-tRNA(Pro)/Cys-tRNA(Cys) deacylase